MNNNQEKRPIFGALGGQNPEIIFQGLPTPCYVIDEKQLIRNGEILASVTKATGAKILLAQKAFSNYDFYPALAPYLSGTEASGLFEAKLGKEFMGEKEVHIFCGAYREEELEEILEVCDHLVFNSPAQLKRFGKRVRDAGKEIGLRINPECSTQEGHAIYDPCAPGSRLGTTRSLWDQEMTPEWIALLDGLHFHTLCEQDSDALETTLEAVLEKFGDILPRLKWLNMGGGHHITRPDYDLRRLEKCIQRVNSNLEIYLEPGEACALNAGFLVSRVLDVIENNGIRTAILDTSAACHMPDCIEMPYTPPVYGALSRDSEEEKDEKKGFLCRLAGPTCLAGDVIGEYYFPKEPVVGDLVTFGDMAIYTTCKNNTFNGMPLPNIWKRDREDRLIRLTDFGYEDFKMRLGRRVKE